MPSPGSTATREFSQQCYEASRALRRLPADVRKEVKAQVRAEVADPLAARIQSAVSGPYASALRGAVKTSADTVPRIKIGGARKVVSGGASARQLVYGTEFGGGKRESTVNRQSSNGRRTRGRVSRAERARASASGKTIYKRASTNQFVPPRPFIFSTVRRESAAMLEAFARVVDTALEGWRRG